MMKGRKIWFPHVIFVDTVRNSNGDIVEIRRTAREELTHLARLPEKPGQAVDVKWMKGRLELIDTLEADSLTEMIVTEKQWEVLMAAVNRETWSGFNRNAMALAKAVEEAEELELTEKAKIKADVKAEE